VGEHEKSVVCPYEGKLETFSGGIAELNAQLLLVNQKLDQITEDNKHYGSSLYGNGKTGLILAVDRLVQADKARQRTFYLAVGSAFAVLGKILWDVFSRGGP